MEYMVVRYNDPKLIDSGFTQALIGYQKKEVITKPQMKIKSGITLQNNPE